MNYHLGKLFTLFLVWKWISGTSKNTHTGVQQVKTLSCRLLLECTRYNLHSEFLTMEILGQNCYWIIRKLPVLKWHRNMKLFSCLFSFCFRFRSIHVSGQTKHYNIVSLIISRTVFQNLCCIKHRYMDLCCHDIELGPLAHCHIFSCH